MINSKFITREILNRYKSIRQFAQEVEIPYSTLKSALDKENGIGGMAVEKALKIFKALDLDLNALEGLKDETLSSEEIGLLDDYRKLNRFNRHTIRILASRLVDAKEMPESHSYIARPLYELPASAGTGQFLDSSNYETVDFPVDVVPKNSTFAVRVAGDSMEPEYHDQSIVFVEQTKSLSVGDVGIFILNNEAYLKVCGEGGLLSLNPNYSPISVGEYDDLRIVGKVVGKYEE